MKIEYEWERNKKVIMCVVRISVNVDETHLNSVKDRTQRQVEGCK